MELASRQMARFCVPYNSTIAVIAATGYGPVDLQIVTSSFFNRF